MYSRKISNWIGGEWKWVDVYDLVGEYEMINLWQGFSWNDRMNDRVRERVNVWMNEWDEWNVLRREVCWMKREMC